MSSDQKDLQQWIGRQELCYDQVTPTPIAALSATLDREDAFPVAGDAVPLLWSWLYFLPIYRQSRLGEDGHIRRGGFLPPITLPRRMWAGGRLEFFRDMRVGSSVSRLSKITDITQKAGSTGPLVFVTVRHEIRDGNSLLLTEEHDIVYRDHPSGKDQAIAPKKAPEAQAWMREIRPNDVLLFRYSALTFNGHRIHYDRRYAVEIEKYAGLIVHGPLIATLLMDLLRREQPKSRVIKFSFRSIRPLFDVDPFFLCGEPEGKDKVKLWAKDTEGNLAMEAAAQLEIYS